MPEILGDNTAYPGTKLAGQWCLKGSAANFTHEDTYYSVWQSIFCGDSQEGPEMNPLKPERWNNWQKSSLSDKFKNIHLLFFSFLLFFFGLKNILCNLFRFLLLYSCLLNHNQSNIIRLLNWNTEILWKSVKKTFLTDLFFLKLYLLFCCK